MGTRPLQGSTSLCRRLEGQGHSGDVTHILWETSKTTRMSCVPLRPIWPLKGPKTAWSRWLWALLGVTSALSPAELALNPKQVTLGLLCLCAGLAGDTG